MASPYTSTPRSTHSYNPQAHQRVPSAVTDTPTPSSHSHNNSLPPLSSIRPMASNPNLKADLGAAALKRRATLASQGGGGLRAGSPNTLGRERDAGVRPSSRLSKSSSLFESELEALAAEPIQRDNTELDRINKENSIQRMIGDLQADRLSLSSSPSIASRSDDAGEIEGEGARRRQFADEDQDGAASSASSSSSRSRSSLSSFRIGLASRTSFNGGARPAAAAGGKKDPLDPLDADDETEDDITYVTLPRSVDPSPARPTNTGNGFFGGSPRRPFTAGAASSPLRPSSRYADENLPPASAAHSAPAPYSFARSPAAAPSYPTLPARSNPPPTFIRSPAAGATAAAATTRARPSPLNPQVNSPILGNSPTATYTGTGSGSGHRSAPSFSSAPKAAASFSPLRRDRDDEHETTFYHLPNATVLTEAIRSPEKGRWRAAEGRKPAAVGKTPSARSGSGSGSGSSQANLVSHALSSLTSKLSTLERENAASASRVAQLEAQLAAATSQTHTQQRENADVAQLRREVEHLLTEERRRSAELEQVVKSLRAQNTHLDAVLAQQHSDLDSLRRRASAPPPAAAPTARAFEAGNDLRVEVRDLKQGLEVLGFEVEGVRTVVEDLLRDREEREAVGGWEREEEERRRGFASSVDKREEEEEDVDRTPRPTRTRAAGGAGTFEVPGTPRSEREGSFVSDADITRLRAEADLEASRRTPRTHHHQRAQPVHFSSETDDEAESYRPSTATFDGESVSYSQDEGPSTPATSVSSSAGEDEAEVLPPLPAHRHRATAKPAKTTKKPAAAADEPDFRRAEQIFADVSRATAHAHAHSPRRRRTRASTAAKKATPNEAKTRADRVVLVEEPSERLCSNCWGRKKGLEEGEADVKAAAEAEKEKRASRAKEVKAEKEREKERDKARRREKLREEHRRTLEGVLERLEDEFGVQKKIYLELTAEYQSMSAFSSTSKRRALADHLKASIDVLEDKARDVKRYADALDDLYDAMHHHSCPAPPRKRHGVV
ncbi:hypothetical protein JCM6882_005567 [Rhodosporidiobolus microsporus]